MNSLVSIIIPTFNGEKFIEQTIESVLNQTYPNTEILIIDDNSSDQTVEILKKFQNNSITLIQNEQNLGLSRNINKAVSICRGEYILILGHDDILPPNHISDVMKHFKEQTVLVHCNSRYIDASGNPGVLSRNDETQIKRNLNPLKTLTITNFIQSCGLIIRKKTFLDIKGWDERYLHFGEWLSYVSYAKHGEFGYCKESIPLYRKHQTNLSTNLNRNSSTPQRIYRTRCRLEAFSHLRIKDKLTVLPRMLSKMLKDWTKPLT